MNALSKQISSAQTKNQLFEMVYDDTNRCIQCGYCLPACPTYESMGKESASPRGRIHLVKMAAEGKIDLEHLAEPIDLCLGCRACEVACPVNVPYGHILESAKTVIESDQKDGSMGGKIKKFVLKKLFPYPNRMRMIGNAYWLYQKTGLQAIVQKTKIMDKISEPMAQLEKVLPHVQSPTKRYKWGEVIPAKGEKKATVAFFAGCITDAMLHKINRLTVELLTVVGCEVVIPKMQNCCGALHAHQGFTEDAKQLAKKNIIAFEQSNADYYINNAGGCGAMLREYDHLFANDPEWYERAVHFVSRTRDIHEILVQYGPLPFKKEWNGIITYQDSCHLRNVQGVYEEPRQLIQSIPGVHYVELPTADRCCASGGIYNLLHFNESMKILDSKMKDVLRTRAKTVVTANPGCLLQMRLGIEREGKSNEIQGLHLVEVLAEACGIQ
ncbi:(Fe-S)-binding protein [Calidifontibacillus erzurumensis]|uniref:Glycolate oxidase iron-sulfur subunit n=1 Tax=Calidifontibacillus erzurumensis TaxID=2741433 RepID=A0A8J8GG57_9BACI|nr:(Fe-S)-binding protein [Calidifontibacillus erzurumensis]NSL53310.1 (Fe-S)-binding protein [Calidifontibacillus erzurumensis]